MEPESERVQRSEVPASGHHLMDVQAVIDSAKARGGMEALERFIRRRLPEAEDAEIVEAAEVAVEIVDSIPIFLARAWQEAEQRDLTSIVGPLLNLAERYFLEPVDLIPEMTQGLAGLLDDAYLVVRVLEHLDKGPQRFLDWDLDYPARFLRSLVGPTISGRLDAMAADAMEQVAEQLSELWLRMSHPA